METGLLKKIILSVGVSTGTRCRAITVAVEMRMEARLTLHDRE